MDQTERAGGGGQGGSWREHVARHADARQPEFAPPLCLLHRGGGRGPVFFLMLEGGTINNPLQHCCEDWVY